MSFMRKSKKVFILDGMRTIVGSPFKSLKEFSAVDLAACLIKEVIRRNRIKKKLVHKVILGNAVSAGLGQNAARQAALMGGLPETTPAYTVNNVCGASLQAVILSAQTISAGQSHICFAGGTESATHSPFLVKREDGDNYSRGNLIDSLNNDGLTCQMTGKSMGELVEKLAKNNNISREVQDAFSLQSHQKACIAHQQKVFSNEIKVINKIEKDDRPRKRLKLESLKNLPSAFVKRGSVTAGNSSTPCDGAAIAVLVSKEFLSETKLKPKARILGLSNVMGKPELTFEMTSLAIKNCLQEAQLKINEVDLFEVAEAFAAPVLLVKKKLKIPEEKLNVYGGDIAFGHPLGAAGARILVTLMHALNEKKLKKGIACISYGGGGAMAIAIESVK